MAILPKQNPALGQNIADILNEGLVHQEQRGYMGYSNTGESCQRKIWYSFHWASSDIINQNANRVFDLGHLMEDYIIKDLVKKGFTVFDEQLEVTGSYGHAKGHIDGKVMLPESTDVYLLEIKTSNALAWNAIVKRGVAKEKPSHYMQMQAYMGKLDLDMALYICYNKNTSEYYTELVPFDKKLYPDIDRKFNSILMSETVPDKIGDRDYFMCSWCHHKAVCHEDATPNVNCRTCDYVSIEMDGVWSCDKHSKILSNDDQNLGCGSYKRSKFI